MGERGVPVREAARCAVRVGGLLVRHRLHLRKDRRGRKVSFPDGRTYVVFRESTCDIPASDPVTLTVWFRLRAIPAGARLRRRLFERLCVLNTVLFAGCDGFSVKLWMVDPQTSDYAGLYSWARKDAESYGRYITAILRPLSVPGTVGYEILPDVPLESLVDE